jgi:hypothetical protein
MYGLPEDVDLSFLVDREIVQVCVGKFQAIVNCDNDIALSIEGDFLVNGTHHGPGIEAGAVLVRLVGRVVVSAKSVEGRHLDIGLDDGSSLTVLDSSECYESFTISGHGVTIVV